MTLKQALSAKPGDQIVFKTARWKGRTAVITEVARTASGTIRIVFDRQGQRGETRYTSVNLLTQSQGGSS